MKKRDSRFVYTDSKDGVPRIEITVKHRITREEFNFIVERVHRGGRDRFRKPGESLREAIQKFLGICAEVGLDDCSQNNAEL